MYWRKKLIEFSKQETKFKKSTNNTYIIQQLQFKKKIFLVFFAGGLNKKLFATSMWPVIGANI